MHSQPGMDQRMDRMRRFFITSGILAVAVAFVLGVWEVRRRTLLSAITMQNLLAAEPAREPSRKVEIDPKAIEADCQTEAKFQLILEDARRAVAELTERNKQLMHTESQVAREIDKKGRVVASERHVEDVWFDDGAEHRQTVEKIDLASNKSKTDADFSVRKSPKVQEVFPLTTPGPDDGYRYSFSGMEQINGAWTIRVDFSPKPGANNRFRGQFWFDAATHEPRRFYGEIADKKPFVDQVSMLFEYGPAENSHVQAIRAVIDGSGGFAMLQKHIRSEIELRGYRSTKEIAQNKADVSVEGLSKRPPGRTAQK